MASPVGGCKWRDGEEKEEEEGGGGVERKKRSKEGGGPHGERKEEERGRVIDLRAGWRLTIVLTNRQRVLS